MIAFVRASNIFLIFLLSASQKGFCYPSSHNLVKSRVIGGSTASVGQLPYQVGLQLKFEKSSFLGTCGGALIADDYVLTAAHCVAISDLEYIEVHLGTVKLTKDDDHIVVIVPRENFIVYDWYDEETLAYDIALLKLPQKVPLSETIKPIDLPTYYDAYRLDLEFHNVTASGWGRYSDASWQEATTLQYTQVSVIDQKVCQHFYKDLQSSNICTSTGRGQGVCHGDSGGPLAFHDNIKKRTILVGLTSFGNPVSCVGEGWPSVFTRVSSYLDWITDMSEIPIKEI